MEFNIILILIALNVMQFIFWSYQMHRLLNKIMSRSYFEYKQADVLKVETREKIRIQEEPDDVEDFGVLEGINH